MSEFPIPSEIRSLPIPIRISLVEGIWDSIVEDQEAFELTDAQKKELNRRLAAHESSPDRGVPWGEVRKRLLGE